VLGEGCTDHDARAPAQRALGPPDHLRGLPQAVRPLAIFVHHLPEESASIDATVNDGTFAVPAGETSFAPGSSGWPTPEGNLVWYELFTRGTTAPHC
jgi:hypothetical protein